jgi:hypothetical protein
MCVHSSVMTKDTCSYCKGPRPNKPKRGTKKMRTDWILFHIFRCIGMPFRLALVAIITIPYLIFLLAFGMVVPDDTDENFYDFLSMFRWVWRPGPSYMYNELNKYE